jgi:ATP-dependent Clp protease ATP-binding subunit ClpX
MGFQSGSREEPDISELLHHVIADDLLEYGLIPEFVGRLPVAVAVDPLDADMLVQILMEPRNALVKQFQRLFSLDNVELQFTDDALREAATAALKTRAGARGLRTILERTLLDVMYDIPSRDDIAKCVIRAETIRGEAPPLLLTRSEAKKDTKVAAAKASESA